MKVGDMLVHKNIEYGVLFSGDDGGLCIILVLFFAKVGHFQLCC
jgi:hypothetical protein